MEKLVGVTYPNLRHRLLQQRLADVLRPLFPNAEVLTEFPFQVGERLEVRSADVGVANRGRVLAAANEGRIFTGAPDLVIEVLSPSNSLRKLKQYRSLCSNSGASVFWVVDADDNTVDTYVRQQKLPRVWDCGEELPVELLGREVSIPVREIFRGITLPQAGMREVDPGGSSPADPA
jgi:Uma2 family endonuclease